MPLLRAALLVLACLCAMAVERMRVVTENWRPYNYEENGVAHGLSTEVVRAVLARAGIEGNIEVLPWARAYQISLSQPNVLIYTMIRIPPREQLFNWIGQLGRGGTTSLYRLRGSSQVQVGDLAQARGLAVLTNLDSMDHLMLKHLGFNKIDAASTVETAVRMFFAGRAPLIAFDDAVIGEEFAKQGHSLADVEPVLQLFSTPPYVAAPKSTPAATVDKLRAAFDALSKEGAIKPVN